MKIENTVFYKLNEHTSTYITAASESVNSYALKRIN